MIRAAIFTDNDFDESNGISTRLRSLLRHAPADVQPRIYTLSAVGIEEPDYLALRSLGVPVPFCRDLPLCVPPLPALARHLAEDHIGVIHLTTPGPAGVAARYLAGKARLPLVGSVHAQPSANTAALNGSALLGRLADSYTRWLYSRCARILAPSVDMQERLSQQRWPSNRVHLWPPGADVSAFSPARRSGALRDQWHVCDKRPAILYAGRISIDRGLAIAQPLGSLLHRLGYAHRFVFVGDGPMLPALRELCPEAVFTGGVRHDDMPTLMASADVMLFPSEAGAAGTVVLEAQACGLPVVVGDRGGAKENLQHGRTGFICEAGGTHGFGVRMSQLLSGAGLRCRMSASARAYAVSRPLAASLEPVFSAYRAAAHPGLQVSAASATQDRMHGALP